MHKEHQHLQSEDCPAFKEFVYKEGGWPHTNSEKSVSEQELLGFTTIFIYY